MEIGARIKRIREQIGINRGGKKISQAEFGEVIGIGRDAVANIETGRVYPDQRTIMLVCDKFNVSQSWLLTGEGEMFNNLDKEREIALFFRQVSGHPDTELDQFRQNLVMALAKLDESEWETVLRIIKKLSGNE